MKEYANAQRKSYVDNELMQKKYKDMALETIERILKNTEHGLITINEGMKALCDPIDGIVLQAVRTAMENIKLQPFYSAYKNTLKNIWGIEL